MEAPASGWPSLALHYQASGHRQSWYSKATGTETTRFSKQHHPVERRFANGDTWRYTYDARDRPVQVRETASGQRWTTTLSWRGQLLTAVTHPPHKESHRLAATGRIPPPTAQSTHIHAG